jgi:hypothetical protein
MKNVLLFGLIIAPCLVKAEGMLENPSKIGLSVVDGVLVLSKKAVLEIKSVRATNPLGPVIPGLGKNKKEFSYLGTSYIRLLADIKKDLSY